MRLRTFILIVGACLVVVGCSSPQDRVTKNDLPAATEAPPAVAEGGQNSSGAESGSKAPANGDAAAPQPPTAWRTAKESPQKVAHLVDAMLSSLSGVSAKVVYAMSLESGDLSGILNQKIKSPTVYSLQYPVIKQMRPDTIYTRADGKVVSEVIDEKRTNRPVTAKRPAPQNMVENWPELAPREVFAGLLDRRKPFTEYVDALMRPNSGYSVMLQERSGKQGTRTVHQYRIYAFRKGPKAAKGGDSEVSIVVDADIHLPVEVSASIKKPGMSREHRVDWNAKWQNNQKFDAKDFVVLKAATRV